MYQPCLTGNVLTLALRYCLTALRQGYSVLSGKCTKLYISFSLGERAYQCCLGYEHADERIACTWVRDALISQKGCVYHV